MFSPRAVPIALATLLTVAVTAACGSTIGVLPSPTATATATQTSTPTATPYVAPTPARFDLYTPTPVNSVRILRSRLDDVFAAAQKVFTAQGAGTPSFTSAQFNSELRTAVAALRDAHAALETAAKGVPAASYDRYCTEAIADWAAIEVTRWGAISSGLENGDPSSWNQGVNLYDSANAKRTRAAQLCPNLMR